MPISDSTADREHGKFVEVSGAPAVRVANPDGTTVASGGGGTSMVDDSAFTPAGSSVTPMGATADEVSPDSVDEGDVGIPRMSLDRRLYVLPSGGAAAQGLSTNRQAGLSNT